MIYLFSRRGVYNRFIKKENVYERLLWLNKLRGILALLVGVVFIIISFTVIPTVLDLYTSLKIEPLLITKYSLYTTLAISISMAIFGIQSMFKTLSRSYVKEKLSKYRDGDLVNLLEFRDYRFNLWFYLFCGILVSLLVMGVTLPTYKLMQILDSSVAEGVVSQEEIDTQWVVHKIDKTPFSLKYSTKAEMKDENGCILIQHGLAYLAIVRPGIANPFCLNSTPLDQVFVLAEEESIIDETEYRFKGYFFDGRKSPDKKSTEFYRNTGGIFGNGFIVEYGGSFSPVEVEKYYKDKEILTSTLKTVYREK